MPLDVQNFILPEMPIRESAGLVRLNQAAQQNREFNYQKQKEQERDKLYNLNQIRSATDPSKFKDVEQHVDEISNQELQKIQNKALQEYINLPPEQAQYMLSKDMGEFVSWHDAAKATAKKMNEDFKLFKEQNKNVDFRQAYDYATNEFVKDFVEFKDNGAYTYKTPTLIKPRDYVGMINTPEALSNIDVETGALQKALESIPKYSVGDKEYISKRGVVHKFDWSGLKTDYSDVVEDDKGKPTKFELGTDRIINGTKLIPQQLKDYLMTNPEVKNAVTKLWGQEKSRIESKGQNVDPKIEPELFDAWLYNVANKHLPHDIKISTGHIEPSPRINVYNSNTSKNNQPIDLTNYQKEGDFYDVTELTQGINVNRIGTASLGAKKVLYNPNTKMISYEDIQGNKRQKSFAQFRQDIATINTGIDLSFIDRLGISGGSTTPSTKPTTKTYRYNGYDYTEKEIIDAAKQLGMTKEAYMKKYKIN